MRVIKEERGERKGIRMNERQGRINKCIYGWMAGLMNG